MINLYLYEINGKIDGGEIVEFITAPTLHRATIKAREILANTYAGRTITDAVIFRVFTTGTGERHALKLETGAEL